MNAVRQRRVRLEFPADYVNHRYNRIHFSFFLQMARMAGVRVYLIQPNDQVYAPTDRLIWSCRIDGQQAVFDYSDHYYRDWLLDFPGMPYFKFQRTASSAPGAISLGPPMVGGKRRGVRIADLESYYAARRSWQYQPTGLITCKQLPNGAAVDRRNMVQATLRENFADIDINSDTDQLEFWNLHQRCSVSVCVPGANNNMIDRGHMELLGLGVCTIAPAMHTLLPWDRLLQPDQHYIQCRDDYSDLCDKINLVLQQPDIGIKIAGTAREFFETTYTPAAYWQWILENLRRHYGS